MDPATRASDMLEDPVISRQWVLRRLQKTLTADLAVAGFVRGLESHAGERWSEALACAEERISDRARRVRELIEHEGGTPYSSVGLGRAASRVGGWLLGLLGHRLWRPLLLRFAEQSYAELDGLAAFARGAPGVSERVAEGIAPEVDRARDLLARLQAG